MFENMLDYIRMTLYAVLIVFIFLLYQSWVKEHPQVAAQQAVETAANTDGRYIPQTPANPNVSSAPTQTAATPAPVTPVNKQGQIISIDTDVFQVKIDTLGGDVVEAKLNNYPEKLGTPTPITLLNDDPASRYIAESGLLSPQGPDTVDAQALYTPEQTKYTLSPNQDTLLVKLNWQNAEGLKVTKIFTFTRNSYEIKVAYDISNETKNIWQGSLYTQLLRTDTPPPSSGGMVNLTTFFGAALSTPDKPFDKIAFKTIKDKPIQLSAQGGWAAMIQHYFISAWVPPSNLPESYYTRAMADGTYTIGMISQPLSVAPGATYNTESKLYTGPASAKYLDKVAPNLKLTIDYGWFWFISGIIFWMMQKIYDVVGNWGWSIVIVTIIIKLLFYQLSAKSYRSMRDLKKLQPKIESLRDRFKDDKQKLTQATLDLYRQEKVNPMSGCLPILIQIPVFIALYWVLVESVELRQAPFILWIHDLSQHDPYYILPILMGASMFLQQMLNPSVGDPMQQKLMMLMPIIFTFLFANFPAGLMLYWFVNNTLSFLQQWFIMHSTEKRTKKKEHAQNTA